MTNIKYHKNLNEIKQECYWDSKMTVDDLQTILNSNNNRDHKKVFSKIIYNSKDKIRALQVFTKEQLREYFKEFKVRYNDKYINQQILVLKSLLLDEHKNIKGLEWKK